MNGLENMTCGEKLEKTYCAPLPWHVEQEEMVLNSSKDSLI